MGFQTPNNSSVASNNGGGNQNRQNWQADAFINVYLPRRDGSRAKLGYIPLKQSRKTDAQLLEYINQNADNLDEVMESLKDRLVLDFNTADGDQSAELDLG